jgi:3-dehydroquinate synthase
MKKSNIIFGSVKTIKTESNVVVIYDSKLKKYKNDLVKKMGLNKTIQIPIKAQETSKNISQIIRIYKILSKKNIDKKSTLIALGGGVIGDISGFIASTYLRGISLVAVPTTVLSQVDSSLGGKNGVNLESAKNSIGTFYQPDTVIIDFKYLKTLSEREIVSGMGEIFKYSLLDKKIKFPKNFSKTTKDQFLKAIEKLTPQCVSYKMKLVQSDELDQKGIRQLLNLGHTFGHVLETLTGYQRYKHGEAVIWGIKFACVVSYLKGLMNFENFRDVMNVANKLPIPPLPKKLDLNKCYNVALRDKKSYNNNVKMVLLKKMGSVLANQTVTKNEFIKAIELLKDF